MARRKIENRETRKLLRNGNKGVSVTLPIELVRNLGWRTKQKVVITQKGNKLIIEDWKK